MLLRDGRVRCAPTSASVRRARQFTLGWAQEHGLGDVADDAALVVSELAANAVIHARTPFEVHLAPVADGVRVEVLDGSATLPLSASLGAGALSGRGLPLVHALARRWGVDPLDGAGKCVWAEVITGGDPLPGDVAAEELLEMWAGLGEGAATGPSTRPSTGPSTGASAGGTVVVVVAALPVAELLAVKGAVEDLVRELQLVLLQHGSDSSGGPDNSDGSDSSDGGDAGPGSELLAVAVRLDAAARAFGPARLQIRGQALLAAERGQEHVTLELALDHGALAAALAYRAALAEVEALSRRGGLVTHAEALTRNAGLRHAYLDSIVDQLAAASA